MNNIKEVKTSKVEKEAIAKGRKEIERGDYILLQQLKNDVELSDIIVQDD